MQIRDRNYYSKKVIIRNKININDDKFGSIGNNFSFKVRIYLDKYRQVDVGLLKNSYIQCAFIILLGQA